MTQEQRTAEVTALFRAMHAELREFVLRRLGPEHVDDVVSDTFEVVWRRWDVAPTDPSLRRGWVYGICKNRIAKAAQAGARRNALRLVRLARPETVPDPAEDLAALHGARALLDMLPPGERDAVALTVLGGLSSREAAEALGCSVSAITTRVSSARSRLTALLASETTNDDTERSGRGPGKGEHDHAI